MFNLKNKVIVVTGGNGLFGKIIVKSLLKFKAIPIVLDLKSSNYKNSYKVDICNEEEVIEVKNKIKKKYGKIYALINNAANNDTKLDLNFNKPDNLENFSLERWNQDLKVALTGSFLCSKYFGKEIIKNKKGGVILNISSDLGLIAPNQFLYEKKVNNRIIRNKKPISYSVVKSGIIGLTKYLSTYWANKNIRCNCLCPGGIYNKQDKSFHKKIKKLIPLNRMANKKDYITTVIWALSENTEYLNGSIISIDGGRTVW